MDILERLKNRDDDCDYRDLNNLIEEALQAIERLRKERDFLKGIIKDGINEIENPLNEVEKEETLLRMYGAIEEGTGDLFND